MSMRYLGGLLTATQNPLTGTPNDSGLFTLQQQIQAIGANQWTGPQDPFFKNVTLLLEADTLANGAQNNTFLDSSANNFTITRNGNTTQGSFSPYGNLWSNYFDGTGDYLTAPANAAFQPGTGDFSSECWFFNTSTTISGLIGHNYTGPSPNTYVIITLNRGSGGANVVGAVEATVQDGVGLSANSAFLQNTWNHVVFCRTGTTMSLFVNGSRAATATNSTNIVPNIQFEVGNTSALNRPYSGYISNARFIKGSHPYNAASSTITVPTAPLTAITNTSLLTCQSNRFIDNSSNNFAITRNGDVSVQRFSPFNPTAPYSTSTIGGSGYFDGTGDWLTTPNNSAFDFGSGNFTIELWAYKNSNAASTHMCGLANGSNSGRSWYLFFDGAGTTPLFYWYINGTTANIITSNTAAPAGTWFHIAVVRNGSTVSMYLNGVSVASAAISGTIFISGTSVCEMGREAAFNGSYFNGYISNVRLVKGTALYTSTFTPPTAPLTAITNTSLLCNFTNAGIYDSSMLNDLETVGNAQVSTAIKKYGTGSLYFDGTGDGLRTASIAPMSLGTGDFTMEFWLYPLNQPGSFNAVIGTSASGGPILNLRGSGTSTSIGLNPYGSGDIFNISYTFTQSTWVHVAVTRSGTSLKLFINGTQTGTTVTNSTNFSGYISEIGTADNGNQYFNGYIDDLRITKDVARYTANFTPPTQQLPNQ